MNRFEKFKNMDIDTFSEWLDEHGQFEDSPWMMGFDRKYCQNCEPIMCHYEDNEREFPCSYCEIYGKCKFFPDMNETPGNKEIIKMWLESEVEL